MASLVTLVTSTADWCDAHCFYAETRERIEAKRRRGSKPINLAHRGDAAAHQVDPSRRRGSPRGSTPRSLSLTERRRHVGGLDAR